MKPTFTLLLAVLFSLNSFSQENTNTLDNQFRTVYKKSNNYLEYKVILKKDFGDLHNNVLDSIKSYTGQLNSKNTLLNSQKTTIDLLEKEKNETTTKLNEALNKENSISLFGMQLSKGFYSFILFTIIIALLAFLGYFIFKFNNSDVLITAAKNNLEDVEDEFNSFRKKSIEREQKLRRQLQDEIIKNRNN
ncbi:hypothetical protein KCTC32516_01422 [Polaribacter huanghezhanensis]|uniref:hypothetical protein n=1 Tax=Polaribacter huanghezhanensis TaxID=1354726 RepID=UPI0026474897|nr:hypothetical protein [Polaribacter huanghezhanensis]WKD86070.1 hypothetical protein KCTC32516_01422 [Polaribacter huanghezhanensis]